MSFGTDITREMLLAADKIRKPRKPKVESRSFLSDCGSKVTLTYRLAGSVVIRANSSRLYCSFDCAACKAKIELAQKIIENRVDNTGLFLVV
jgi:hypothetical protein